MGMAKLSNERITEIASALRFADSTGDDGDTKQAQRYMGYIRDLSIEIDGLRMMLEDAMIVVRGVADGEHGHAPDELCGAARGPIIVHGPCALVDLARSIEKKFQPVASNTKTC